MSNILQGFLDDIVAHPDDPSLWLILADWLDDRDDPRAELVRLTWQLSHEPDHADFAIRQARVQALLAGGMIPVRPRMMLGDIEFVWIPPGTFHMGVPPGELLRQRQDTFSRVTLTRPFWLGVHPVTQAQYQRVMGTNPSHFQGEELPVENVYHADAWEFCAFLGRQVGKAVELPTDAEWEYACRAGTTTPFHWGGTLDGTEANCNGAFQSYGVRSKGRSIHTTSKVGSYVVNPWGLYDMHGNVWEWCADGFRVETSDERPEVDPFVLPTIAGGPRRVRGGSWNTEAWLCRAGHRDSYSAGSRNAVLGFRVALRLD